MAQVMDDAHHQQQPQSSCDTSALNSNRSPKRHFFDFDNKRGQKNSIPWSPAFSSVSDSAFVSAVYGKQLDCKPSDPALQQPELDSNDAGAILVC